MNNSIADAVKGAVTLADQIRRIKDISKKLNDAIEQRRAFEDRLITALSDIVCSFISEGIVDRLPEEFQTLTQRADDYMLYQTEIEEDRDYFVNCIRVYQITSMIKRSSIGNKRRIAMTEQVVEQYEKYYKVLEEINHRPGIAHKYLCDETGQSASNLSHIVKKLEEDRLLFSRREGKMKYYMLTNMGLEVFNKLREKNQKHPWTTDRLKKLSKIIQSAADESYGSCAESKDLIKIIGLLETYDENQMNEVIEHIKSEGSEQLGNNSYNYSDVIYPKYFDSKENQINPHMMDIMKAQMNLNIMKALMNWKPMDEKNSFLFKNGQELVIG